MRNTKLNQKGLGLIEALLVIIAITLVAFVGYYIYNAQKTADKEQETAATSVIAKKDTTKTKASVSTNSEASLKAYLLETCSSADSAAINAVFKNQSSQTVETDSMSLEGNYAVVNVKCTLSSGSELSTLFLKNSNDEWGLVVKEPVGVSCEFLTSAGFPDSLKAPYCQNP